MARPRAEDYEERLASILDKAAELFARSGFLGASVSEIAKACDVSKSLLYHYYDSKEDILYGVMTSHIDMLAEEAAEACAKNGDPEERLRDLLHRFMRHYANAAARQKVLLNDLSHLPSKRRNVIVLKQRKIVDSVQMLLVEINPLLANNSNEARVRTMLLFGMINWTSNWYDSNGPITPSELADLALTLAISG